MNNILLIEDDMSINKILAYELRKKGYLVDSLYDGKEAVSKILENDYDLVLIDWMLPYKDGVSIIKEVRQNDYVKPLILLTARSEQEDIIKGLEAGADDYLTKPFHLDELSARIRNLTLRKFTQNDIVLKCSNLSFNTKTRKADVNDEELSLTRKETGILEYLMLNQGRPVSQEELIEHVWDSSVDNFSNSIRVHISSLRKKLRNALDYDPIHNRISEGYVMEEKK